MNRKLVPHIISIALAFSLCAAPVLSQEKVVRHEVQAGENLRTLTEHYGIPAENIEGQVEPGSIVTISPPRVGWPAHRVLKGQTLYAISKLYSTRVKAIQQANGLQSNAIKAGSSLEVPVAANRVSSGDRQGRQLTSRSHRPSPSQGGWIKVRLEDGTTGWVESRHLIRHRFTPQTGAKLVSSARRWLGTPYSFGGQNPNGVDCSGLVQEVFRLNGYSVPRMADAQYKQGRHVNKTELQEGDLVFFETYTKGPSHVGIYSGKGKFIHASSSRGVMESGLEEDYYRQRYLGARRMKSH